MSIRSDDWQDEISTLRRKLPGASDPADDAAICIPPPVLALLAPLVAHGPSTSSSAPLASAISQRLKLLQTENDELYELLRVSEAARAREEVVGLRKIVKRLEGLLAGTFSPPVVFAPMLTQLCWI